MNKGEIAMKKTRIISQKEEKNILEDFERGMNTVQLAKKYDRNSTTIGRLLKKNGLQARNIKEKLTKEQVYEAYGRYKQEVINMTKLGQIYKVDAVTIANSFRRYGLEVRPTGWVPELPDADIFSVIDTEEKAYFLGLLMCDGSIIENKGNPTLRLELGQVDKHLLESFASFLGLSQERVRTYVRPEKNLTTCVVSLSSKKLCQDLKDKGVIRNKTGSKRIPSGVPHDLMRHTIRGMIDADGSVRYDKKMVELFGGGSMTEEVSEFLFRELSLSIKPKVTHYANAVPRMSVMSNDYKPVVSYLYKDASVFLKRKNPYFQSINSPAGE